MFKFFTTSLALALASLASAETFTVFRTTTVTETFTSSGGVYTATSQYSYPTTTSADTAPPAVTHAIQVGPNGTLTYSPNSINASVGDTVQFFFSPKNHTATQSSFGSPCIPLVNSTNVQGFKSNFVPTNETLTTASFSFVVNDTKPIWGYCAQKAPVSHCGAGMVFAINAPTSGNNTFENFLALAKASGNSSTSTSPSGTAGTSATGTATGTATGATSSSTGVGGNDSGAISTSVNFGLTAFLAAAGAFIMWW